MDTVFTEDFSMKNYNSLRNHCRIKRGTVPNYTLRDLSHLSQILDSSIYTITIENLCHFTNIIYILLIYACKEED